MILSNPGRSMGLLHLLGFVFVLLTISGCGSSKPEIVAVNGSVLIDDKPVSNAEVRFVPMSKGLDGNYLAKGITDKEGNFALSMPGKKLGCPVSICTVLIKEGPVPDKIRMQYESEGGSNDSYERFKKSLKNRPIPKIYQRLSTTPLKAEVSPENTTFSFDLQR